jgi:peptidoglycan/xylan/chitin deacetylase (PgdA/CDA1 family)
MPLNLPAGKRLAVSIGVDFDAQCAFSGHLEKLSPAILSRGDFDVEVGTPRLLRLFQKHEIPTTWCTPGHTMITFPDSIRAVIDQGHEIAAHGAYHESVPSLGESEERRLMDLQLSQHEQIVGIARAATARLPGTSPSGRSASLRSTVSNGTVP